MGHNIPPILVEIGLRVSKFWQFQEIFVKFEKKCQFVVASTESFFDFGRESSQSLIFRPRRVQFLIKLFLPKKMYTLSATFPSFSCHLQSDLVLSDKDCCLIRFNYIPSTRNLFVELLTNDELSKISCVRVRVIVISSKQ